MIVIINRPRWNLCKEIRWYVKAYSTALIHSIRFTYRVYYVILTMSAQWMSEVMKNRMKSDHVMHFYPNVFIVTLIHYAKINNIVHIHPHVPSMELWWSFLTTHDTVKIIKSLMNIFKHNLYMVKYISIWISHKKQTRSRN